MVECGLLSLGSCLPQKFFEYLIDIFNAPITPFLNLILRLLSEPINISLFKGVWVIIVYVLSMLYGLLLLGSGIQFIISGHDVRKRDDAKQNLQNIAIMIVLVQASFFIYKLTIELASIMTSATLSLINTDFFLITTNSISDVGLAAVLALVYVIVLIGTAMMLTIRYAFVSIGVALFPLAIFCYFLSPLKQYGSLILNFLGVAIFVTFIDAILLIGFSELVKLPIFGSLNVLVLVSAFLTINLVMAFLLCFSIIKTGFKVYTGIKTFGSKL
jgi:hypothetical protein